jgi:hypothetical protein
MRYSSAAYGIVDRILFTIIQALRADTAEMQMLLHGISHGTNLCACHQIRTV